MITDELLQIFCCFGSVIYDKMSGMCMKTVHKVWRTERHLREEVVNDMEVGDIMKEEAALPAKTIPVDGGGSTSLVVPFIVAVVGKIRVGVVEICDHDEPVGDFQPGDEIVLDDFGGSIDRARPADSPDHGRNADVRHDNRIALRLGE